MQKNIPIYSSLNLPLSQLVHYIENGYSKRRRYTKTLEIEQLAATRYKSNGRGISLNDLLAFGFATHKAQAQSTLKYCLKKRVLYTISNHKPQQYYPTCLRSEIASHQLSNNTPIRLTGVGSQRHPITTSSRTSIDQAIITKVQTLMIL